MNYRIFLLLSMATVHAITPAQAQRKATASSAELLNVATLVIDNGRFAKSIFLDYHPPRTFVICDSTGITVIASRRPVTSAPPTATRLTSIDSIYVRVYATPPADLPSRCFSLRYQLDGVNSVAFPLVDSLYSATGRELATLSALFHEAFHIYQGTSFAPTVNVPDNIALEEPPAIPTSVIESDSFKAAAGRERTFLAAALANSKLDSVRTIVGKYIAARKERMKLAAADRAWAEEHNERKEGVAQYVGYKAALRVLRSEEDGRHLVISDLMA